MHPIACEPLTFVVPRCCRQQCLTAKATLLHRALLDCVPRWVAALSLFAALARASPRLVHVWTASHNAVGQLTSLVHLGVPPILKAAALAALAALVAPATKPRALASAACNGITPASPIAAPAGGVDNAGAGDLQAPLAVTIWQSLNPRLTMAANAPKVGFGTPASGFGLSLIHI